MTFDGSPKDKYIKDYISEVASQYRTPPSRNRHSQFQVAMLRGLHTTIWLRAGLPEGLEFIFDVYICAQPAASYIREIIEHRYC